MDPVSQGLLGTTLASSFAQKKKLNLLLFAG